MLFEDHVILIADGVPDSCGDYYFAKNVSLTKTEYPVYLEFNEERQVAKATLALHDDKVYASFNIEDRTTQEIIKAGKNLTPCIGMVLKTKGMEKFDPEKHLAVPIMVGLCSRENSDPRIPPLKNS